MSDPKLVYAIEVDGVARYFGEGTRKRAFSHIAEARRFAQGGSGRMPHYYPQLLAALGTSTVTIRIIKKGLTKEESRTLERNLIEAAPAGQLWNRKAGIGLSSAMAIEINARPEVRAKHRHNSTALWSSPAYREKMRARKRPSNWHPSEENKQKIGAGSKRFADSLTADERSQRARWASSFISNERRIKALEIGRSKITSTALSRRAKTRWANFTPDQRAAIIAKANAARLAKLAGGQL